MTPTQLLIVWLIGVLIGLALAYFFLRFTFSVGRRDEDLDEMKYLLKEIRDELRKK